MTKAADFNKMFESFFSVVPTDTKAFTDVFKNSAEFSGKMTKIALDAAEKNAELSQTWTKDTLAKLDAFTKAPAEPSDYAKLVSDFVSKQSQATPEHLAAFAEVAKKAQMDTVELLLAAGKDVQAEAAQAVQKATKKAA
ncbi:MAG: phasin family protein [Pseudomonadota bacterium]